MRAQGKITLDWGYIFDYLSILNVKLNLCEGEKQYKSEQLFLDIAEEIKGQIGADLYSRIISSPFYKDLYELNKDIFSLVDEVKNKPIVGKEIDIKNYDRHIAKNALQMHFFNSNITEIKDGYE